MSNENVVQQAVQLFVDTILRELQDDPHQWSERPCSTCRTISSMVGKPFGCYEHARRRKIMRERQAEKEKKNADID